MRAVADAGPLIHLSWIGQLDLLSLLFDEVIAPAAVQEEVLRAGPGVPGVAEHRHAFASGVLGVQRVLDVAAVETLASSLDRGESEALVLKHESHADLLLIDERRARARAEREGYPLTGTIGILRMARDHGLIRGVGPLRVPC